VASVLANHPRPDLVEAGVAPNPDHGFTLLLPPAAAATLMGEGRHMLEVKAIGRRKLASFSLSVKVPYQGYGTDELTKTGSGRYHQENGYVPIYIIL